MDEFYRKAVRVLSRPSPSVRAAIECGRERANKARDEVKALLNTGADAMMLYKQEADKERRIVLLGYLRRGDAALKHH